MSEQTPLYESRSPEEVKSALDLAAQWLPPPEPFVVNSGSLGHTLGAWQETDWRVGDNSYSIVHVVDEHETEKLMAMKVEFPDRSSPDANLVKYLLIANNGRFLVSRESGNIHESNSSSAQYKAHIEGSAEAIDDARVAEEMEFELGLMKPDSEDWSDFLEFLRNPPQEKKIGRLTRILRRVGLGHEAG